MHFRKSILMAFLFSFILASCGTGGSKANIKPAIDSSGYSKSNTENEEILSNDPFLAKAMRAGYIPQDGLIELVWDMGTDIDRAQMQAIDTVLGWAASDKTYEQKRAYILRTTELFSKESVFISDLVLEAYFEKKYPDASELRKEAVRMFLLQKVGLQYSKYFTPKYYNAFAWFPNSDTSVTVINRFIESTVELEPIDRREKTKALLILWVCDTSPLCKEVLSTNNLSSKELSDILSK